MIDVNDIISKSYGNWYVIAFDHIDESKQYYYKNKKGELVKYIKRDYYYLCNHKTKFGVFVVNRANILKHLQENNTTTRLYYCWCNMKSRCYYENNTEYKNYGGRGIAICDEWKNDYNNFKIWALENGYKETLTIDRIDVNGNYEPSNCRWADNKQQGNNTTRNHYITYNGKTQSMQLWAEELGMSYTTIRRRLNTLGWSVEKAFNTKITTYDCKSGIVKDNRNRTFLDTRYGLLYNKDLSKVLGIDSSTIAKYIDLHNNSTGDKTLDYYINKRNITNFEGFLPNIRTYEQLNPIEDTESYEG